MQNNNTMLTQDNVLFNSDFVQEALYDKFKEKFFEEIRESLLNQKAYWLGDIGYVISEIKHQGTKSGEVIKNVKLKLIPTKNFKKSINQRLLNK